MALISSSMLLNILIFLSTIIILIILYFKIAFKYWKNRGIPYITPSIPFGNIGAILFGQQSLGSKAADIYREIKKQGADYGGYFILNKPVFLPTDPELVKHILVKDFTSFEERGTHYDEKVDPLSGHLFSVRNPKWYKLRMTFSPLFTQVKLKNMFPMMVDCSKDLKTVIKTSSETGEPVDIKEILARFSTDIISSCAFGLECNSLTNPDAELRKVGHEFMKGSLRNSLVLTFALIAPFILKIFKIPICNPAAAKYFLDAIKYTIDNREKYNIERNDMVDLLIKLKNNESIDEKHTEKNKNNLLNFNINSNDIAAQCFIFFLGGFETSSSSMSFTIYELTQNVTIQDKLRKEILGVLTKYNGELTYDALMEMTYLDQVVQETLRKYPPIPMLNRECTKDYTIPGTDKVIEKGTSVVISALGIHRDPEFFENPDCYDPERFSLERKDLINANTYLPFGLGPRNCIGLRFGVLQTKIGLIVLLRNYKFTLDPKTKIPPQINKKTLVMDFENKIWLQASKI